MNQAWECPRCGRINAPFNPACFCREDDFEPSDSSSVDSSEHVTDAVNYLMGGQPLKPTGESSEQFLKRKYDSAKKLAEQIGKFQRRECLICGVVHNHGQHCATLKNNIPPNGEFI